VWDTRAGEQRARERLRRPETAFTHLARRHALERVRERGLLGWRERGESQAGVRQQVALAVEAPPSPKDSAPGDVGRQAEPTEHRGEFDIAACPRPQEAQVLQAGPPDAEVEEAHFTQIADPSSDPPGQGSSGQLPSLALLAHGHLVFGKELRFTTGAILRGRSTRPSRRSWGF
jgi:hypothetical protein